MKFQIRHIVFLTLLLLFGGMMNEAWAAKVTYHILTLPMSSSTYHIKSTHDGKRMEAIRVIVDDAANVELPTTFRSPLATDFTYYAPSEITKSGSAEVLYDNGSNKGYLYEVNADAVETAEGTKVENDCEYYVTYSYNNATSPIKLDGSVNYNVAISNGFLAYNRGRNNRPAVIPKTKVSAKHLTSEDFVEVDVSGTKISPYWVSGDNKNKEADVRSQFNFLFKYLGNDPYNIIISTAYARNKTYIEKFGNEPQLYKWYKESYLLAKSTDNAFLASDDHKIYTTAWNSSDVSNPEDPGNDPKPGYFHNLGAPIWNTVALLNNTKSTGYIFIGSRCVDGNGNLGNPSKSGNEYQYYYLQQVDNNNLKFGLTTASNATNKYSTDKKMYEIKTITFKVTTPYYKLEPTAAHTLTASIKMSEYSIENDYIDANDIPEELKRKYCTFTRFYDDAAHTKEITNYSQVTGDDIYVDYEVAATAPFTAITPAASYDANTWKAATWYELTDENETTDRKIKYDSGSNKFKNNGVSATYEKLSEYAFIGDPYELRVISRSETSGSSPYYVSADGDAGNIWEIPYDDTDGSMLIRKYKSTGHWYWNVGEAEQNVSYSTTASTRVKVMELPKFTYTYHIVDKSGQIAVKASALQTIFSPLSIASIPSIIVSPFLANENVYFYKDEYVGSGRSSLVSSIEETPNAADDIYVTYTTADLNNKPTKLSEDQEFNVVLNGEYIYYADGVIKSKVSPTEIELKDNAYLWKLRGRDPYAMLIDNLGAREDLHVDDQTETPDIYDDNGGKSTPTRQMGAWVKLASAGFENGKALDFTKTRADAQRFIAKSSTWAGVYEVMVATGTTEDASSTYYNIGRPETDQVETDQVKIYYNDTQNSGYAHGSEVLKFKLEQTIGYTYHLIDKAHHDLLQVTTRSPDLVLPADYQSPLVDKYYYYDPGQINIAGLIHTVKGGATELTSLSELVATYTSTQGSYATAWSEADATHQKTATSVDEMEAQAKKLESIGDFYFKIGDDYYDVNVTKPCYNDIYVTYDKNDLVKFNDTSSPYLLKFLQPYAQGYYLEDGNDKLILYDEGKTNQGRIQAVYPYTNGDGNLNIYGEAMNEEQMNGGANTRPRWVWFFDSDNNDPYHVKIHSKNTISYRDVSHPTYLQTQAVQFYQDPDNVTTKHIVTGGGLPGVASTAPTEYMILGVAGEYKLMTTNPIDDGNTNVRRTVTSLEQYWKNYNMLKKCLLNITVDDPEDTSSALPENKRDDLMQELDNRHIGRQNWHSYEFYASAIRWSGGSRVVEKLEHWYQTFDMGNGTFDIISANIPPVLILLDLHGWEVMRRPLPTSTYPNGEELKDLKVYDSPMVKEYKFYNNATKASGCHKYSLRLDSKTKEERDQIKLNGVHYTSSSLAALPPLSASGVVSSGVINDFYVTYTVKDEYKDSYGYKFTDNGDGTYSESEVPSKFLVVQHGRFYKTENSRSQNKSYFSKPISEHTNPEGGNVYDMILDPKNHGGDNDDIIDGEGHWKGNCLWYVKPNQNIDKEMGIKYATVAGGTSEPKTEFETKKDYYDKGKAGFDPYNLQIQLLKKNDGTTDDLRYMTTHITSTHLDNGIMVGDYDGGTGGTTKMTLEDGFSYDGDPSIATGSEGYDHTNIKMSNQTFMAVSDANGNMQLMPRFDHTKRVDLSDLSPWETTLKAPVDHSKASASDNASMGSQTTFFVRPQVFEYIIIDNKGNESLRYKTTGEYFPSITAHFKSPLATDFKYYKDRPSYDSGTNTLTVSGEITGSFASAGVTGDNPQIFVRYSYDESADNDGDKILQGKWFTIKLNSLDVQASGTIITADNPATDGVDEKGTGVSLYTGSKPSPIDAYAGVWQWKFLAAPTDPSLELYYRAPDPYAIELYNRKANYAATLDDENSPMGVPIKVNGADRFALLSHKDGYALAVAGENTSYRYSFLNGADMTTSVAATTVVEETHKLTVADDADFASAKAALNSDGVFYFKINGSVVYKKVTKSGETLTEEGSDETAWTNGANKQTVDNDDAFDIAMAALTIDGDYYFKINSSVTYKSVTVISGTAGDGVNCTESDWNNAASYEFTIKHSDISPGSLLQVIDDVTHEYTYKVYTNATTGNNFAVSGTQTHEEAAGHSFVPYLPEDAQSPLLNMDDYLYYGSVKVTDGNSEMVDATKLHTLYGLYDDIVHVRYNAYDRDKTNYKVPNKKAVDGSGNVARANDSKDVAMNIEGGLPYNIIWEADNMMKRGDADAISCDASHDLSGDLAYIWLFVDGDPYALKIKHKNSGKFVNGTGTLVDESSAGKYMLLRKEGWDYGILQETGGSNRLTNHGEATIADDPTKFIIFGLSAHKVIYHLVIGNTGTESPAYIDIPYREGTESSPHETLGVEHVLCTTQRDLTSQINGVPGDKYQLGHTYMGQTYCVDAGQISVGDVLKVPNEFIRPNCNFLFYIDNIQSSGTVGTYQKTADDDAAMITSAKALADVGYYYFKIGPDPSGPYTYKRVHVTTANDGANDAIYTDVDCTEDDWNNCWQDDATLNSKYKGLKLTEESPRLMSDAALIGCLVKINIAYGFNTGLTTNAGDGFVTSVSKNLWYTFETKEGPYLAHYTNAWGLQAMKGRDTRYTNDYLWTPLGDVYGFKMYNRYVYKTNNETSSLMTTEDFAEGRTLKMAAPRSTITNEDSQSRVVPEGNEVYELLETPAKDGYFYIHPVINDTGTKVYIKRNDAENDKKNYAILSSTNPTEWTFGLTNDLVEPYRERAGYVGGLNEDGVTAYEAAGNLIEKQAIVYNDDYIVKYKPGYYRLHNQPGVSGINPVRYASGYLHEIEKTAGAGDTPIPMHFYSKKGVNTTFEGEGGLISGFTETAGTRGEIPVPATEYDPSTIFYFQGDAVDAPTLPTSTISTQELYVRGDQTDDDHGDAKMTATAGEATTFTIMDIGGAVFLIHDGSTPQYRKYLHFSQSYTVAGDNKIYDLKYFHNSPTDDAKWCLEPANNQGLKIVTNNGGDGYYYATFYAPFDVELPANADAYTCGEWNDNGLHPTNIGHTVPARTPVIIRTSDLGGILTLTLPNSSPSSPSSCVFKGSNLEQLLTFDGSHDVYTFGLPFISHVEKDPETYNPYGDITAPQPEQDGTGVGFYINATPNKEADALQSLWRRNNLYVLHNKIYYRADGAGTRGVEFVPVIFDDEEGLDERQAERTTMLNDRTVEGVGDGCVYDLQGRKVATKQQVEDGTWRQNLRPGIYIINGKKYKK